MKILILTFLAVISFSLKAQTICTPSLGEMPTQSGGRVKPLYVLATESFRFITGTSKPLGLDPVVTFCELSFESIGMPSKHDLPIKIEHTDTKNLLHLSQDEGSLPASKVLAEENNLRIAYMKIKETNAFKKDIQKVMARLELVQSIRSGATWTFPQVEKGKDVMWISLPEALTEERVLAFKQKSSDPFSAFFDSLKQDYIKAQGDAFLLENHYVKGQYFTWALGLSLLALCIGFASKKWQIALGISVLSIIIQITAITIRVFISGRAPVTNMYETVMFSGLGCLIIGLILTLVLKRKNFLLCGLVYNILCLMMMKFSNNMLESAISPLVPVLRDNFWLSTHVTSVILSYAALALSWVLANMLLIKARFFTLSTKEFNDESDLIYTAIKVGVVLLAGGIILGGVWADYSWGRFWGWDPKETWSLIVLLVYMAILHGRYSNWITKQRFVPLVAGAFMSVMMAWFGVNYILASGLHSYGFSEGGAIFLGTFFLAQMGILFFVLIKTKTKNLP